VSGENTWLGAPRNRGLDSRPEEIIAVTQRFCAQHLDMEYSRLCAKLVRALARHRSSPLEGGQTKVWAGAVLCTIGQVNFFFQPRAPSSPQVRRIEPVDRSFKERVGNPGALYHESSENHAG
jgi:hypothetical protein